MAESLTTRLCSLGGSIGLTVWLQFASAYYGLGFDPKISPSLECA